jgi:catechol 2,3-dioxygenase-like lactoylglutathione lyase family enzyme
MLDHVSLPVGDLALSSAFYDAMLACLGMGRRKQRQDAVGYGLSSRAAPVFWILQRQGVGSASPGLGSHLSFQAEGHAAVDAFHRTGLSLGGRDAGAPGPRPAYTQPFYGAFLFDPDGFKIEAVCRGAPS